MRKLLLMALLIANSILAANAFAEEFEVKMLNKGDKRAMVFEPDFIKAMPGDTIKFLPTDKGHNVESIKGMMPEGVAPFKSDLNEEFILTVEKDGVYGIKCTPHYTMGMVALIAVGEPANANEAKAAKVSKKAEGRFAEIFATYEATN